jgi:NitT/TauT family transport system substrate-binding protein
MRRTTIIVLMFMLASFIISCGNNTPTPTPELPVIKLGWTAWASWYPIVLVKELGLDVKHGFRLELIFNEDVANNNSDWETGQFEAVFGGTEDAIKRNAKKDGGSKVIFISDRSGADTLVALSEIKTIADLKGKRIGTIMGATYGELMVQRMLQAHGLSIQDAELVNMDGSDVLEAMPKTIDAGVTWEPYLTKAKEKGFNTLYSSAEDPTLPLSSGVMIRTEVLQAHPEAVRGLVAAWFEAVALWQADPAKYSPLVAKVVGGSPEEIMNGKANFITLEQNLARFQDGSIAKEAQNASDFLIRSGQLNHPPDINNLLDGSFLKQVKGD